MCIHGSVATATATATAIATATAAAAVAAAAAAAVAAAAAGAPVGPAAIGAVICRRKPSSCRKPRRHACRATRGWRHLQAVSAATRRHAHQARDANCHTFLCCAGSHMMRPEAARRTTAS